MLSMMHRFLNLTRFAIGVLVGLIGMALYFDNRAAIVLHLGPIPSLNVPLWSVALVPLFVGLGAGYLYQLPARMHHVAEHYRHRQRVHELEKELRDLHKSFDQVVAMPGDERETPAGARLVPLIEHDNGGAKARVARPKLLAEPQAGRVTKVAPMSRKKLLAPLKAELATVKLPAKADPDKKAANGHRQRQRRPAKAPTPAQ
ncbi:MAG: LapA family protein [Chloroflexi bacterium]|nr:MAG: LapA family protein [Chloroflexota bacterium]